MQNKGMQSSPKHTAEHTFMTFDSFANSKTRLHHMLYISFREQAQSGGGGARVSSTSQNSALTSKDSHAPSLSDDKNGWVTPADKGLEPLTLHGEGGLGDRCTEQWCRPTASLDHDLLQSS